MAAGYNQMSDVMELQHTMFHSGFTMETLVQILITDRLYYERIYGQFVYEPIWRQGKTNLEMIAFRVHDPVLKTYKEYYPHGSNA